MTVGEDDEPSLEEQIREAQDRLHVLGALRRVLEDPPRLMELLAASADPASARDVLREQFGFDEVQAMAVTDLQLRRVTHRERARISEAADEVEQELRRLESLRP